MTFTYTMRETAGFVWGHDLTMKFASGLCSDRTCEATRTAMASTVGDSLADWTCETCDMDGCNSVQTVYGHLAPSFAPSTTVSISGADAPGRVLVSSINNTCASQDITTKAQCRAAAEKSSGCAMNCGANCGRVCFKNEVCSCNHRKGNDCYSYTICGGASRTSAVRSAVVVPALVVVTAMLAFGF